MSSPDPHGLQEELAAFRQRRQRPEVGRGRLWVMALALGLGGGAIAYGLASWNGGADPGLRTSEVDAFQEERLSSRGRLEFPGLTEPEPSEAIVRVMPPAPTARAPDAALLEELEGLRDELSALQAAREADVADLAAQLRSREEALEAELSGKDAAMADLKRRTEAELATLRTLLEARQDSPVTPARYAPPEPTGDEDAARRAVEEQERRTALEAQAAELEEAKIRAPAVVFAAGGGIRREGSELVPSGGYRRSADEAYVDRGAPPLIIEEAKRLTDPDRTLAQGTVIQAALQTAINSDLPGNVVAVVSEPVPAFSGDAVLVPRGSRLFGQYRAGAELNQKRILVLWTRILTPDGTSMEIASVAGDPLGRSGLAGDVDTKFDERFGGAALVSLIGAAPALAARSSGDVVVAGTLENVGDDLGDASETAIARQLDIAPTIRLAQGETVTVLVDRDVVIR